MGSQCGLCYRCWMKSQILFIAHFPRFEPQLCWLQTLGSSKIKIGQTDLMSPFLVEYLLHPHVRNDWSGEKVEVSLVRHHALPYLLRIPKLHGFLFLDLPYTLGVGERCMHTSQYSGLWQPPRCSSAFPPWHPLVLVGLEELLTFLACRSIAQDSLVPKPLLKNYVLTKV